MKTILFAASALSLLAAAPASAQMMMGDGMAMGGRSCVSGGQFVPCPTTGGGMMMDRRAGMQPGMMEQPGMYPPEMSPREERRMMRRQRM
ncbi:MAG: hypothetical protein JWR08_326 [Enterovirga sp.]|nr:hypothetical protein [Enterovirga sp.]